VVKASRSRIAMLAIGGQLLVFTLYIVLRAMADFRATAPFASCGESNESEIASPSKAYVAMVFVRNCGATTGYVTHVNLRTATDIFRSGDSGVIHGGRSGCSRKDADSGNAMGDRYGVTD
jgi:hypothetical protein